MKFYRRWQPVKAMTFDLDDTLYDNHPHMRRSEQATLAHIHAHFPAAHHTDFGFWRGQRAALLQQRPELINDVAELRRLGLTAGFSACGLGGNELLQAVENVYEYFYFTRSDFTVEASVHKIMATLAERLPLIAITNGNVNLQQIGIADYFQHSLHASLQQPMKPAPHMFKQAAEILNLAPECILHVGDNLEKDVWGGRSAGFKTAWYAIAREMNLNYQTGQTLPDVQLDQLDDLLELTPTRR